MPTRYFETLPVVAYNNRYVKNLIARSKFFKQAKKIRTLYYDYTIKDGERPDVVAYNYYGNSEYYWVIFLVNDIVDPYYDWPMDQNTFEAFLKKKYGSVEQAMTKILFYQKNPTTYYINNTNQKEILSQSQWNSLLASAKNLYTPVEKDDKIKISKESWETLTSGQNNYFPVYAYNFELDQNEAKRRIKLLDLTYLNRIEKEFKDLMK